MRTPANPLRDCPRITVREPDPATSSRRWWVRASDGHWTWRESSLQNGLARVAQPEREETEKPKDLEEP